MCQTPIRRWGTDTTESELKMLALQAGVTGPQAKACQQPPEAGRGEKWIFPKGLWRMHSAAGISAPTCPNRF